MTIITRIQASASSSNSIVDSISTNTLSATATLIDALGDKGWQVTADGNASLAASYTTNTTTSQLVFVLRGIVNPTRPSDFTPLGAVTMADLSLGNGIHFDTAGSTAGRARYQAFMTATAPANSLVTSNEFCIVYRVDMGGAGDYGRIWYKRTGRPDSTPDHTSGASTADVRTFTSVAVAAGITLTDLICIVDEGYTDTQCAEMADDLRAVFPVGGVGTGVITVEGSVSNSTSATVTLLGDDPVLSFTSNPLVLDGGTVLASRSDISVDIITDTATGRSTVLSLDNQTTDGSGVLNDIQSASLTTGDFYRVSMCVEATVSSQVRPLGIIRVEAT